MKKKAAAPAEDAPQAVKALSLYEIVNGLPAKEATLKGRYEIPFTRYFYKYEAPKPSAEIMAEILELELDLDGALSEVFDL